MPSFTLCYNLLQGVIEAGLAPHVRACFCLDTAALVPPVLWRFPCRFSGSRAVPLLFAARRCALVAWLSLLVRSSGLRRLLSWLAFGRALLVVVVRRVFLPLRASPLSCRVLAPVLAFLVDAALPRHRKGARVFPCSYTPMPAMRMPIPYTQTVPR